MDGSTDKLAQDRRSSHRHNVRTALRIRVGNSRLPEHRAESINLSRRGIYFATRSALCEGEIVEMLLKMPEEVSGEQTTEWRCTGHVVRVEPFDRPAGKLGIGVQFYRHEVPRPEQPPLTLGAGPTWHRIPQAEHRQATRSASTNGLEAIFKQMEKGSQRVHRRVEA